MIDKNWKKIWTGLVAALCLYAAPELLAQGGRGGGGGGGGGFGGGFGGGGGGGNRGGAASGSSGSSTRDYGNSTMIGDATFSVDPETHKVVVVTDEANYLNISNLLVSLDRPKPQVLINAVFLEVTHNDASDIGVQGTFGKNYDPSSSITNLNLLNSFGLGSIPTNATTIGNSTIAGNSAGIYSVAGKNFTAQLQAIAGSGKTEILSRPSVLVRNNQPATITVGQSVPLITGVTFAAAGNNTVPINTVSYTSVGIILQVTPFITSKGLVEMIVSPQISSLSDQKINIGNGAQAPVINLRSATTVVVTPDGQTVVIGGLMEHDKASVTTKIPFLGDLPWIGNAFARKQKSNTKTELLIFLTPHVVVNEEQLAIASNGESGRADMVERAFGEKELNKFFDNLPMNKSDAGKTFKPSSPKGGAANLKN